MKRHLFHWTGLVNRARIRFREDQLGQVASSLTFTTLLALVPLVTIMLAVFSAFPMFDTWSLSFKRFLLTTLVPESAGKVISIYMLQFAENANRLTAIGIVMLALSAVSLMMTIEATFNTIWRVRRRRPLATRLMTYWAVLTAGPVIVGAGLSFSNVATRMAVGATSNLPLVADVLLFLVPLALSVAAFAVLYMTVPNRNVDPRHALLGALVAGVGFDLTRIAFAAYVKYFPALTVVYGAFASLPLFLISLYLTWWVILLGAVVAAELGEPATARAGGRRSPATAPAPD